MFREYIDPGTWRVNSAGLDECKSMFSTLTILICSIALFILPYWMWLGLRTPGGRGWVVTESSLSPPFSPFQLPCLLELEEAAQMFVPTDQGGGRGWKEGKQNHDQLSCLWDLVISLSSFPMVEPSAWSWENLSWQTWETWPRCCCYDGSLGIPGEIAQWRFFILRLSSQKGNRPGCSSWRIWEDSGDVVKAGSHWLTWNVVSIITRWTGVNHIGILISALLLISSIILFKSL